MELTDDNVRALSQYLNSTLSPDVNIRRPAEKFLASVEANQNYTVLLFHLIEKQDVDMTIRIAGSIAFKNCVKRIWPSSEDDDVKIPLADREELKKQIVDVMLRSPEAIQRQLSEAVSIMGRCDFPDKWPDLITNLVEKIGCGDFYVINGVLRTAHSLFRRYRHEFSSNTLWSEIKFVLTNFAIPLTDLLKATMALAAANAENAEALKVIYSSLCLISKIFYSLNYQDLPEVFEDNIELWMTHFLALLSADVKCLQTDDDEEAGVLEQLRSQVCDNVALYVGKYMEEFEPYLSPFVTAIWNLLMTTGQQPKNDELVSNALQFLAKVAGRPQHKQLFEDPAVLSSICEKVVIPNLEFRAVDEELFEDNPDEYIRRDIEGSDVGTRRRAACDLVSTLSDLFEHRMMEIFGQYIQAMLAKYAENPTENWRCKDAALYLVMSSTIKGKTEKHGITKTSDLVNLVEFATAHVLPELEKADVNVGPVMKADAIKYVMIFRSILPIEMMFSTLPQLVRHLGSNVAVVHTYSACAIEKILAMRAADNSLKVKGGDLAPLANDLLTALFNTLLLPGAQENEYVMKAVMRSFCTLQEHVMPFLGTIMPKLTHLVTVAAKNPSKPHFNHYLFETLGLAIKIVCSTNPGVLSQMEQALFPLFQDILQQDVVEFIPYVFQLLALLLEQHKGGTVPEPYMMLFPCLLAPVLWERPGNVSPLTRLLQAFVTNGAKQIAATQKVTALLGVWQKLIASKSYDSIGFSLLDCIIEHFEPDVLAPLMKQVFVLLFQRMTSSKTVRFELGLTVFIALYAVKYGASAVIKMTDSLQPNMFGMVVEKLICPNIQKISLPVEKKIAIVGITKMLCEAPELVNQPYASLWLGLLETMVRLIELKTEESTTPDDHFVEIEDNVSYRAEYSPLQFAKETPHDPVEGIPDVRVFLAQSLTNLSQALPDTILPQLRTFPHLHYVNEYYKIANLTPIM